MADDKKKVKSLEELLEDLYSDAPETTEVNVQPLNDIQNQKELAKTDQESEIENNQEEQLINNEQLDNLENLAETEKNDVVDIRDLFSEEIIDKQKAIIEASLYVAGKDGINIWDLKRLLSEWELNSDHIHAIMKEIKLNKLNTANSGLLLEKIGENYKFITKHELNKYLSKIIRVQLKSALTTSLLETLAIIAYNDPCMKATIEKIRNSDATNALNKLLALDLIYKAKRSDSPGNPWLYKVTNKFFDLFGIKSLSQLPKIQSNMQSNAELEEKIEALDNSDTNFFDINRMNFENDNEN